MNGSSRHLYGGFYVKYRGADGARTRNPRRDRRCSNQLSYSSNKERKIPTMAGRPSQEFEAEVVVVGSGIAGLSFALKASQYARVLLLTKKNAAESNTNYAQGGIACVTSAEDSSELHIRDTLAAGAGLCREDVVRQVVKDGPARVAELVELGVRFTERQNGAGNEPDLGKEAGHTKRRVLHAGDITGKELEKALLSAVRASSRIEIREDMVAIDLVTSKKMRLSGPNRVMGIYVLDGASQQVLAISAKTVFWPRADAESAIFTQPIQPLPRGTESRWPIEPGWPS